MAFQTNPELRLAREFVEFTNRNVFLTGKAGTGKTTFLHNLQKELPKRMVVVAPTGVAAINARGVTIHSFFQLPFGPILPGSTGVNGQDARHPHRYSRQKIDILRTLDLLIIDEVSMVRADLLDGIDEVLRRFRKSDKPFGGVQLLMIGDLQQLAPVVKDDEWQLLRPYYQSAFFFGSHALQKTDYVSIELKHIFRQQDEQFIELLNKIRDNRLDTEGLDLLNRCYRPEVLKGNLEGYITLTTHNYQSRRINNARLEALAGNPRKFSARVEGNFPESNFPTDYELVLKTGAQVMFVKNDSSPEKLYYNGKIGKVTGFSKETIFVKCPEDPEAIAVKPDRWDNTKYKIDEETREIREEVEGTFTQYPLKTAWAITIHKSQGLTFEKAIIDANAAFAHGQVYVALSRCKTLEGLVLTNPLDVRALKTDPEVKNFIRNVEENPADDDSLEQSKRNYRFSLLKEMFDFTSMERQLAYTLRVVYENKGSVGMELPVELGKMKTLVTSELKPVAEKFMAQVERMINETADQGNENLLQDRLKKACEWFYQRTDKGLGIPFEKFSIETDNKAVRKTLNQAFERLGNEIMVRRYTFDACRDGFAVKKYLEAKAKGLLENGEIPKSSAERQKSVSASVAHPELYARLKNWRDERAAESDRPVYMILQVKSMRHIADALPASLKALKKIHGFGKSKLEQYGREVLDIVLDYCKEKNLALPADDKEIYEIPPSPPKKEKVDTKQVTFNLFKKGKNIDEIAKERQLTKSTIYNHVSHFVRKGEVNVFQFVSSEKVKAVEAWLKENHAETLTQIKQHFGDEVSWDELRLIVNHVAFTRNEDVLKPANR
ncbi:MAG: hypothetical protein PWQ06_2143 [Anaerophaga sp.]|nr:hypothetical protein [Anaerophaga sp.]